jgi:hypothetical protein
MKSFKEFINESKQKRVFKIFRDIEYDTENPIEQDFEDFITYCNALLSGNSAYDGAHSYPINNYEEDITLPILKKKFEMFKNFWNIDAEFPGDISSFIYFFDWADADDHDSGQEYYHKHLTGISSIPNFIKNVYYKSSLCTKEGIEDFFNLYNSKYNRILSNNQKFKKYF